MAVRDDVRQLATKKAQAFVPDPNLTPVAPTATIGNRDPSTRKPNKGFKRFMVGPGGDYSDLADPGFYARGLADEANKQVVQPLAQLPSAFDPTADLSMADRISRAGTGALVAADLVTPFVPEGTIANALRREAMEKALDREVAGYAASGGGAKYRGGLILHGSPEPALDVIEARTGSFALPDTKAAYGVDVGGMLRDGDVTRLGRAMKEIDGYSRGQTRRPPGEQLLPPGTLYAGRVPSGNRIVREQLPPGTVKIADDRFDNYVVSSQDIPVLSKSDTRNYWSAGYRNYNLPKDQRIQGPSIPTYKQEFGDDWLGRLDEAQSSAFSALLNAPLRPGERKQVERALAELLSRQRFQQGVNDF